VISPGRHGGTEKNFSLLSSKWHGSHCEYLRRFSNHPCPFPYLSVSVVKLILSRDC